MIIAWSGVLGTSLFSCEFSKMGAWWIVLIFLFYALRKWMAMLCSCLLYSFFCCVFVWY